ncbi:hypothetical protein PSTG_18744 [Puccinia striiformis f. sp. tritici PST-78]|uniref:Uncharacterized protein n=1 Tax=Puccinia striiformis f. sp. tritici PST-78 TaxID=1165861 RepID=A0A0L0ULM2_9BASI|nr:hypothetical protein PSTG_18744 [Puccinia striiformis f. sp. tritici PST-78]
MGPVSSWPGRRRTPMDSPAAARRRTLACEARDEPHLPADSGPVCARLFPQLPAAVQPWEDERSVLSRILRRPPEPGDVQELLCGPRPDDLPDEPIHRRRILEQAKINRSEFVEMVETILNSKEADEREDQLHD